MEEEEENAFFEENTGCVVLRRRGEGGLRLMVSSPKLLFPSRPTGGHSRHFFPPKRSFPRPTLSRPITEANGQQHPLPSLSNVVHFPPFLLPPVVIHDLWPTCIPTARRGEGGRMTPALHSTNCHPSDMSGGRRLLCNRGGLCEKSFSLSLYISPPLQEEKEHW